MDLALSTCWNASRHREGYEMIEEIREMGFKSVELGHNLRFSLWPGVLKAVKDKRIRVLSLHNFCPVPIEVHRPSPDCYEFTASTSSERNAAVKGTIHTLEGASEVGAAAVVLHLGSYHRQSHLTERLVRHWKMRSLYTKKNSSDRIDYLLQRKKATPLIQDRLKQCLDPILKKAGKLHLRIGVEFRSRLEEYPHADEFEGLFRDYAGSPLGYWHDFGHAAKMDLLGIIDHSQFLKSQSSRIIGAHLQDFSPPHNDHLALGEGSLPLKELHALLPAKSIKVLELSPRVSKEKIVENLQEWQK